MLHFDPIYNSIDIPYLELSIYSMLLPASASYIKEEEDLHFDLSGLSKGDSVGFVSFIERRLDAHKPPWHDVTGLPETNNTIAIDCAYHVKVIKLVKGVLSPNSVCLRSGCSPH